MQDSLSSQYIVALILYVIAYIYAINIAPFISKSDNIYLKKIDFVHESCYTNICNADFSNTRGNNYYIDVMDQNKQKLLKTCFMTFWGLSHFVLYSFLGYFAPDLFLETFMIGVAFEGLEKYKYDCHDLLDIGFNSVGFLFGRSLNRSIYK